MMNGNYSEMIFPAYLVEILEWNRRLITLGQSGDGMEAMMGFMESCRFMSDILLEISGGGASLRIYYRLIE